jgi:uncharacterized membrane protein YbhN (UPF0104 family)
LSTPQKKYDVSTVIRLFAPKQVGVTLAPLAQIEEAELFLFWSAVFCALFTALLGSVVSLLCASYSNAPVLWILLIFLLVFFGLFIVFSWLGFMKRRRIRKEAIGETLGSDTASLDRLKAKYETLHYKATLLRLYHNMSTEVFKSGDTISWEDFRAAVRQLTSTKTQKLGDQLVAIIVGLDMVKRVEGAGDQVMAVFDKSFDVMNHEETSWQDLLLTD